jgi:transcriptional regulator with XRE-family HTH domain
MSGLPIEQLSRELMRVLRGGASQRQFSRALGFTSNVAYTWETGRRFPEASVFLRAAGKLEQDFEKRLREVLALPEPPRALRFGTPRGVHWLVGELSRQTPVGELALQLEVDRTTLSRWVRGTTEPRLPELLRLIAVGRQRLLAVVELLADPRALRATRAAYDDLLLQERLAYDLPWSHALLRALELDVYRKHPRHDPTRLARAIGIPAREAAAYLQVLEQARQITWDGTHYQSARVMAVDTRNDPAKNLALKRHWARVGVERLGAPETPADALFSFNLFAVSEGNWERIRKLQLEYYDRVRAIVDEAPGTDHVVLMNLQLIPLEHRGRRSS